MNTQPNVLFIMTDQQRADTIAALGNSLIHTPNLDRLVRRGVAFTNAYSTCPVCLPARYTIRTGCEPPTTRVFLNQAPKPVPGQAPAMEGRCGPYLARTMARLGYRAFGIGKFHAHPWDEDLGYDLHLHGEELYGSPAHRARDSYAAWIAAKHPEYDVENLMGERTEMYYMPQRRPMPAHCAIESWATDRAIEQIRAADSRPFFGLVSFIAPHPPFAPPIPFNRMYNPDRMPNPICGPIEMDHMDEQIPWMNHAVWAEDIAAPHARVLKARYYGAISYIDQCLGRILDAVEARPDADNTLIAFFADHGDMLGDHHAWQKECFFEGAAHIPFLLSWPHRLPADARRADLVSIADLFGMATAAAGAPELREGVDLLGMLAGAAAPRETLPAWYGEPGSPLFKIMVRHAEWKYIFMANGGREQLFNLHEDPDELKNRAPRMPKIAAALRAHAIAACRVPGAADALAGDDFKVFPFTSRQLKRILQFDNSRGVKSFPEKPGDILLPAAPDEPPAPLKKNPPSSKTVS